ncbi:MAG: methylated-DNA--[protein]-cysteine S-methyltransferase [Polyangiaceae bacterium]
MTPAQTSFACFDTAIGRCALAWSARGVRALCLPDGNATRTVRNLLMREARAKPGKPTALARAAITALQAYLRGQTNAMATVPLDLTGHTPFLRKVYGALREVPAGHTISYGQLAKAAGSSKAARAVGRAMARNPLPILIPCHRVLTSDGGRGGYSGPGGLATKAQLLALEGVALRS